jgi:pyridoxine 5-phosphate synthase
MSRRLGVNIDHVATVRQARRARYPDPLAAALVAERAGADQITAHLRLDRRHIHDEDLRRLRASVQTELNVECAVSEEMAEIMLAVRPHRVTLVAERAGEITTEGGLDVARHTAEVSAFVHRMTAAGIRVALFIDPDEDQIRASRMPGVDMVELNTSAYADGHAGELDRLARACGIARDEDLIVAAGHGLTLHNLGALVRAAPEIEEYNIGHALIGDAIFLGLERAVERYKAVLASVPPPPPV